MSDLRQDKVAQGRRRSRIALIVAIALGVIAVATAFFDDAIIAYQTWRHGAPGIAQGATEDARSAASAFWPFARAICADPAVSARELGEQNPLSDYRLWNGGYDLTRRIDLIELRQRRLYGHRWDQGWMLQSVTVDGNLDSVKVERLRLGPTDGPAPSTYAIYDQDCRLIAASFSEIDAASEWQKVCFGPGWIESDCDALQERPARIVDVSNLSFDDEERHCFDATWSQTDRC